MRKALLALTIAAFGIGTSEFVIMGLLPDLARSFSVSIPKAGVIVSAYALSVTFGSPVVAVLLSRMERKRTLVVLMSIFLAGNLCCAFAPTYGLLLAARILTALCHGAFFGTGSIVAANLVPRNKRAQAIAIMFSGLTLANVLGVPAGTAIGHALGWRATFLCLVPIGLVAALGLVFLVHPQPSKPVHLKHELHAVMQPKVLLVLALSTLSSVSLFTVFTYIAPMLGTVTRLSESATTWVLVLFGVGITVGNLVGGKLSDWRQMLTILGGYGAVAAVLFVMPFTMRFSLAMSMTVLLWGMAHFAAGAPLQARIVEKARKAPNLASTLNQGAFNLGNALGASLGGLMLTYGASYRELPIAGAVIALVVIGLGWMARRLDRMRHSDHDFVAGDDVVVWH